MQLVFCRGPSCIIATMSGELDLSSASSFRLKVDEELRKAGVPNLILSLKGLAFVDSTGLGAILGRHRQITRAGGKMVLTDVAPRVMSMLEMAGLSSVIPIMRTSEDALRALTLDFESSPRGGALCEK